MLTPRVILCQVLFSVMIYAASKFGKKPLVVTTVLLLLTLVHLFSPALLILQATVILTTAVVCYHRIREREVDEMVTAFRNILDRLTRK